MKDRPTPGTRVGYKPPGTDDILTCEVLPPTGHTHASFTMVRIPAHGDKKKATSRRVPTARLLQI